MHAKCVFSCLNLRDLRVSVVVNYIVLVRQRRSMPVIGIVVAAAKIEQCAKLVSQGVK